MIKIYFRFLVVLIFDLLDRAGCKESSGVNIVAYFLTLFLYISISVNSQNYLSHKF